MYARDSFAEYEEGYFRMIMLLSLKFLGCDLHNQNNLVKELTVILCINVVINKFLRACNCTAYNTNPKDYSAYSLLYSK